MAPTPQSQAYKPRLQALETLLLKFQVASLPSEQELSGNLAHLAIFSELALHL